MNETILTWLVFILAFGGMILIHELGHFIVARLCKIEVEEFGIGLPTPGAITLFTWKGTRFTLNWLPLGGFVRPKGENDPNVEGGLAAASPWKRLAVLSAGPLMNILAAVVIFTLIFHLAGVPDRQRLLITEVLVDSPAERAGLQVGDIFVSGDGQPIRSYEDLRAILDSKNNIPVVFVMDRNGKQMEFIVTPQMNEELGRVLIGVGLGVPFKRPESWTQTTTLGIATTFYSARSLIALPAQILRGTLAPEQGRLIGLKGIYDIMSQSVSRDVEASANPASSSNPYDKPIRTLNLLASLSISLGIFNLLPFPALDGGRILFVLPELIFRRRVPHQVENLIHGLGMALLLALMIYINIMDFINPVTITLP
ncbi:MAG TPA: M50 family metallopeptidase [Anaerolineales bacterium]|nr:M50 family metallopeptidase [Anaerolineales bacterium]